MYAERRLPTTACACRACNHAERVSGLFCKARPIARGMLRSPRSAASGLGMGGGTAEAGAGHAAAGFALVPGSRVLVHATATQQPRNQATRFTPFSSSPNRE